MKVHSFSVGWIKSTSQSIHHLLYPCELVKGVCEELEQLSYYKGIFFFTFFYFIILGAE